MTLTATWPALQLAAPLPARLAYERAVWGKVHGAPTDFRWIARSNAFDSGRANLATQLNLGGEDAPARFHAWRNLGDRCHAVSAYPSRAIDAAGRRGFLEKQVLEWRRPAELPAAVGALLLLARAAQHTDDIWWERNGGELAAETEFSLPIAASEHEPVDVDEDQLRIIIERGRQQLRELVTLPALEQLYAQILSSRRPALLAGLPQPLPAEAVAVLLLPLPRAIADRISIAGWIPSHRPLLDDLGGRWDVLVTAPAQVVPASSSSPVVEARCMAEALLSIAALLPPPVVEPEQPVSSNVECTTSEPRLEAPLRPGFKLDLEKPDAGAAPILDELHAFAADVNRRWLAPETLRRCARPAPRGSDAVRLLTSWIRRLEQQRPGYANERQWRAKIDVLRSAAIVLVPEPSTVQMIEPPAPDSRVPALAFALLFEHHQQWDSLAKLGEKPLRELLQQSVGCQTSQALRDAMRRWMRQWQSETRRTDVSLPSLIANALASPPR